MAVFVLNYCLIEFLLSAFTNRFELGSEQNQLIVLCYTICPCSSYSDTDNLKSTPFKGRTDKIGRRERKQSLMRAYSQMMEMRACKLFLGNLSVCDKDVRSISNLGGTTLRGNFFLRKKGHFLKIKRALLCLLQNLEATCPQYPSSYIYGL